MLRSSPPWWSNPSAATRYAMAALSIATAIVAGLLLDRFLESAPFVSLFLCAIMFASWFGGVGPGLLATALSISAFDYFFLPPMHTIAVAFKDIPRLILFAITAAFVIALNAAQRSAARSLRRTRAMNCRRRFRSSKDSTRRCKSRTPNERGPSSSVARPNESFK